jgi:UDP-glucose:tetrahydrobiopterin glucosyltransferase
MLGWVGRIAPEKGLEDAARAAAIKGLPLSVWGFNENPDYRNAVIAAVPDCDFHWQGFLPTEKLQQQLGRCQALLVTPKWEEGFGINVLEAMACGVPVVAYRRGGPAETIDSGITGILVDPDNINKLVTGIAESENIDRIKCRKQCEKRFSLNAYVERIEKWIKNVLQ